MDYALFQAEEEVRKAIAPALKSLKVTADIPVREAAPGFGDLSSPIAFSAAKQLRELRKSPIEIAEEIAFRAKKSLPPIFSDVKAEAGFVNFWFSEKFLEKALKEATPSFGESNEFKGRKAIVEYSSPNVGKPLHVGHARATVYGHAVKNLLKATGYNTIAFNYPGDAGKQVAEILVAIDRFKEMPAINTEKDLLDYYVRINKEIEGNEELEEEVKRVTEKIEGGDAKTLKAIAAIRKKSFEAFDRTYKLLGVKFDEVLGESELIEKAKEIVGEAVEKGLTEIGEEGETVALLEKAGLSNNLLLRSNGTTLYFSRDLALADYKWKKYAFDLNFVLTAAEQNLHFRQVFAFLKLLDRKYADKCAHVGFGHVTLPEGRISTREGRVVLLEDVLSEAVKEARGEVESRLKQIEERTGKKYSKKDSDEIARDVGVGSLKFAVLRVSPEKEIKFDFKKMVSFEGDTGAYLQYTFVRTNSILEKAGAGKASGDGGEWMEEEKRVAKTVSIYPRIVSDAAKSFKPHVLCEYLLRLAGDFSSFYEKCPVLKAEGETRERRLKIVRGVQTVLGNGLALLGIPAPKKM